MARLGAVAGIPLLEKIGLKFQRIVVVSNIGQPIFAPAAPFLFRRRLRVRLPCGWHLCSPILRKINPATPDFGYQFWNAGSDALVPLLDRAHGAMKCNNPTAPRCWRADWCRAILQSAKVNSADDGT